MSERTYTKYKENRLAKLRLGQAVGEITELASDPETRLALVPLTDGEYISSLEYADKVQAGENPAGFMLRDEVQKKAIIFYAAREIRDLSEPFFADLSEVSELPSHDVNHLYDIYLEMVATSSPSLMGLSEEDFHIFSKLWEMIDWNALNGPQWYAAQRFLNSVRPNLLQGKFSGSRSTTNSTQESTERISAPPASSEQKDGV